jgi:hypothetical protein
MENKKSVVFISVPYSKNPSRGEELSYYAGLFVRSLDKIPFSPVFNFENYYDNGSEYDAVLRDCVEMLKRCDEALFIGDNSLSNGQKVELEAAGKSGLKFYYINANDLLQLFDTLNGCLFVKNEFENKESSFFV